MFMMNKYYDKNYVFPTKKTTQLNSRQSHIANCNKNCFIKCATKFKAK